MRRVLHSAIGTRPATCATICGVGERHRSKRTKPRGSPWNAPPRSAASYHSKGGTARPRRAHHPGSAGLGGRAPLNGLPGRRGAVLARLSGHSSPLDQTRATARQPRGVGACRGVRCLFGWRSLGHQSELDQTTDCLGPADRPGCRRCQSSMISNSARKLRRSLDALGPLGLNTDIHGLALSKMEREPSRVELRL
jgi:hypothetical protein